jgi:hypothetical protein
MLATRNALNLILDILNCFKYIFANSINMTKNARNGVCYLLSHFQYCTFDVVNFIIYFDPSHQINDVPSRSHSLIT